MIYQPATARYWFGVPPFPVIIPGFKLIAEKGAFLRAEQHGQRFFVEIFERHCRLSPEKDGRAMRNRCIRVPRDPEMEVTQGAEAPISSHPRFNELSERFLATASGRFPKYLNPNPNRKYHVY